VTALAAPDAAVQVRQQFGLEAAVDGQTLTVPVPAEQWQAFARFARETLGCRFFNFLTAIDWKEQGLEVVCRAPDRGDARTARE
jgi:hypothetical protein